MKPNPINSIGKKSSANEITMPRSKFEEVHKIYNPESENSPMRRVESHEINHHNKRTKAVNPELFFIKN